MSMPFDESLLSAYLDGELTPQERQLVEEQLRISSAHRQTLRSIRELQQQLAALPAEAFSGDVVDAVHRRISAAPAVSASAAHSATPAVSASAAESATPARTGIGTGTDAVTAHRSTAGSLAAGIPREAHTPRGWQIWLPLGLAAGVLAIVTLVSLRRDDDLAVRESTTASPPASEPAEVGDSLRSRSLQAAPKELRAPAAPNADGEPMPPSQAGNLSFFSDVVPSTGSDSETGQAGMAASENVELYSLQRDSGEVAPPASGPLLSDARLFKLSEVAGQWQWQPAAEPTARALQLQAETLSPEDPALDPLGAAAPRLVYQLPQAQIDDLVRWMSEQYGGRPMMRRAGAGGVGGAASEAETTRPVAVVVHAPADEIARLLRAIGARIAGGRGAPAANDTQVGSSGEAVLLFVPVEPEPLP